MMTTQQQSPDIHYSDWTMEFIIHPVTGDLGRVTETESVKRSLKHLILTNKYERLLDPRIGGNINKILFEPMDGRTSVMLHNYIKDTISNYEPRVRLTDLQIQPDFDNNLYSVTITFSVFFSEALSTLSFNINRVR